MVMYRGVQAFLLGVGGKIYLGGRVICIWGVGKLPPLKSVGRGKFFLPPQKISNTIRYLVVKIRAKLAKIVFVWGEGVNKYPLLNGLG